MSLDTFAAQVREFLDAHVAPLEVTTENWGSGDDRVALLEQPDPVQEKAELEAATAWRQQVFDAGFGWLAGPTEYGGAGLTPEHDELYRLIEGEYQVPGRAFFGIARNMLAPAVLAHGTAELKEQYLRPLFRGDMVACQLFSEPGAGSDLAGVSTRAVRVDGGWLVNGQKVWTSYAHVAKVGELLARTDPAAPKHHGLSMFVVDMSTPGITVRPLRQMNGGSHFNEVFLDDVFVPEGNLIGEPGSGWKVAATTLTSERGAVGSGESTVAAPYVQRLDQLLVHQGLAADVLARQDLAKVYVADRVMAAVNEMYGKSAGAKGSVSKLLFSRQLERVADTAVRFLGDAATGDEGSWGTFSWTDFLLSAPGLRFAGGTDEIMLNILGERVLGLPREPRPEGSRA
ncbi:acyl-CoA dehydrogenase [Nakamurella sp. YIM 132087]|uniref:Acyl-CoA dehydrogenase n=1 Tax=Nakamurella alba TaxID=2665158 RepID=A0A7K1FP63_9ACTN|nr:acyl-CoA dehydrogenase family protein [Nakamurella alba]MTD15942.1 acyl-CoA dehydrogenase [Nakamurella alba]